MLMLLSPAKSLQEGPALAGMPATQPAMLDQTGTLIKSARQLSSKKLQELMHISKSLGDLNRDRFKAFELEHHADNAKQAALLFDGDVYKGLDAATLSSSDLEWAQEHVGILSGLYGILRPMDLVQPYRLEMGTALKTRRGARLYDFWGPRVTKQVNCWLDERGQEEVVNLASNEYWSVVQPKKLRAKVITPVFRDVSEGKAKVISFFAKRARGAMVRWAVEKRASRAEELKGCDALGYAFVPELSTETEWAFQRAKPDSM